jgi:hypothetical protein
MGVGERIALGAGVIVDVAATDAVGDDVGDTGTGSTVALAVDAPGPVDAPGVLKPATIPGEPDPPPGIDRPPRDVVKVNAAPSATTRMTAATIVGIGRDAGRAWCRRGDRLTAAKGPETDPDPDPDPASDDGTSST